MFTIARGHAWAGCAPVWDAMLFQHAMYLDKMMFKDTILPEIGDAKVEDPRLVEN